jgi:hypothetical protein
MNVAFFVAVSAATMGLVALVLGLAFTGVGGRRAMAVSAGIAMSVQCVTFVMVQRATRVAGRPIISAWVAGMVLRFVVMAAYALLVVRAWQLAPTAALVSLAIFFFLSTLLEPWLLQS